MAIWGFGAMYGGKNDMLDTFVNNECVCVGWNEEEAPSLHRMLKDVKTSDFVFIKSLARATKSLTVRAIGVVVNDSIFQYGFGTGLKVNWIWVSEGDPLKINITAGMYKNNVFNNTLYEEYDPSVQKQILDQVFATVNPVPVSSKGNP